MLTVSDDKKEQERFESLATRLGLHFAYGVTMASMSNDEAEAFVVFVSTHGLTEQPPARSLDLYYGVPADLLYEEELDAV